MGKRSQKPGVFQTVLSVATAESAVGRKDVCVCVCEKKDDECWDLAGNNRITHAGKKYVVCVFGSEVVRAGLEE